MVIFVIKILSNSSTFDGSVFIKKRANLFIHYLQVVKILSTHKREVIEIAVYKKSSSEFILTAERKSFVIIVHNTNSA